MDSEKPGSDCFIARRQKYVNNPSTPEVLILWLIFKRGNAVVTEITSLNYRIRSR